MKRTVALAGFTAICLLLVFSGCSSPAPGVITQVSTMSTLLGGGYESQMTCGELQACGDIGIGTFEHLDGEMVMLDGRIYQVGTDGNIRRPAANTGVPFAMAVKFEPRAFLLLRTETDRAGVEQAVAEMTTNTNLVYVIKLHGRFSVMQTRSVPPQAKPYPPLGDVLRTQTVFDLKNVSGTAVGFRCPTLVDGISSPGYHFHFLADDLTSGGHVLDYVLQDGTVEIEMCDRLMLVLPHTDGGFETEAPGQAAPVE